MNKKISLSMAISISALVAAVTFILTLSFTRKIFNDKISEVDRLSEKYQRLEELDAKVQAEFYTDIPTEDVINGMLAGYVSGLGDRYSTYRTAEEFSAFEDSNAGVYTGIGITVQRMESGDAEIVAVAENGSAEKAGIAAGDVLVAVSGIPLAERYDEAINAISGELGTTVFLTIRRNSTGAEEIIAVNRAQIDEVTVSSEMLAHRIGYIRITKFRTVTVTQFQNAMHNLMQQGAEAFVFDVRNNGGGVLDALEKMVDPILPEGELAFAYDKHNNATPILVSDAESMDIPMAVLVNGGSASAAELFACLLRDYSGAILVGEKTFGKGIMQTTFLLSSGGVTLTTATYATGITPCYHGVGLEPDILSVPDAEAEEDTQLNDAVNALAAVLADDAA